MYNIRIPRVFFQHLRKTTSTSSYATDLQSIILEKKKKIISHRRLNIRILSLSS